MKITRRQLRKLILKEFRELGNDDYENININVPPIPPADDEGGGGGKDWPAELIKRLHKKGYNPPVNSRGKALDKKAQKVLNSGESMISVEDLAQNSGLVIQLHAREYRSNANQTDADRMRFGPMMIAASKFESCDNGMDVNNILRKIMRITRRIEGISGESIYLDLERLNLKSKPVIKDEFDFNTILNNDDFLIDYYSK